MNEQQTPTPQEDVEEFRKLTEGVLNLVNGKKAAVVIYALCHVLVRLCMDLEVKKGHLLNYISEGWENEEERTE